jgi:hypothetical protein
VRRTVTVRDPKLAQLLRNTEGQSMQSDGALAQLSARIVAAAAPVLDERAAPHRTIWDYTERWSATLLPIGAFTAIAAGLCLFALSAQGPLSSQRTPGVRLALLGAATNRVSSQSLVDFLVASDSAVVAPRRSDR